MNQEVDLITQGIMRLIPLIDVHIVSSLLLIRHASRGPSSNSMCRSDEQAAWNVVLNAPKGRCIQAIKEALHLLAPRHPWFSALEEAIGSAKPDEQVLQELITLLSFSELNDAVATRIFEHQVGMEKPRGASSFEEFYTPRQIAHLLFDLLEPRDGSLYDPCCGSGSILCQAPSSSRLRLYGQSADFLSYQMCQTNAFLHDLSIELGGMPANALTTDLHTEQKFDYVLTNIPFNLFHGRYENTHVDYAHWLYDIPLDSNANFAWVQHIVSHLEKKGRAAAILPNGTLTTQHRVERAIRQNLLEDGLVEAVIALPPRIFRKTNVPCCLWIFNKARTPGSTTLLVDARTFKLKEDSPAAAQETSKLKSLILQHRHGTLEGRTDWYAVASLQEICEKRSILSPNLYTQIKPIPISPIQQHQARFIALIDRLCLLLKDSNLLSHIRPWKYARNPEHWESAALLDVYQPLGGLAKKREFFGHGMELVDVKTVIHHSFLPDSLSARVEVTEEEIKKYQIKAGDILLNRSSESVAQLACCCIVPEDRPTVYGSYIKCLRPRRDDVPNPFYMAGYLRSAIYRQEVERVSPVYTTRTNINLDRLSDIFIYYPDVDTQNRLGETLFTLFQYQKTAKDEAAIQLLTEFESLLIEQMITYPILCLQKREDNNG